MQPWWTEDDCNKNKRLEKWLVPEPEALSGWPSTHPLSDHRDLPSPTPHACHSTAEMNVATWVYLSRKLNFAAWLLDFPLGHIITALFTREVTGRNWSQKGAVRSDDPKMIHSPAYPGIASQTKRTDRLFLKPSKTMQSRLKGPVIMAVKLINCRWWPSVNCCNDSETFSAFHSAEMLLSGF